MIKYFAIENYLSIKDEVIIEMDLNLPADSPFPAQPVIAFAGANASGKSNVLKAINFVLNFAANSFFQIQQNAEIPVIPFISQQNKPTKFHIIVSRNEIDFSYEISLTKEKVLSEKLEILENKKWKKIYHREENKINFGRGIKKIPTENLRKNASIISYAAQFETQEFAKKFANISVNSVFSRHFFDEKFFTKILQNEIFKHRLLKMFDFLETGIVDFTTESQKIFFIHLIKEEKTVFSFSQESEGTLQFIEIFYFIFESLKNGNLLIIDELELKLHQDLASYLIEMFRKEYENSQNSQLIFSFHNSNCMDFLSPTQLYFVEKNFYGETEIICAKKTKNIKKKILTTEYLGRLYRAGRFGATTKILSFP